jgi:methionyl-tRNA formyltransferase
VVVRTGPLNSESMRADLAALDPDFLILGGIGILSEEILDTARIGALNAHPALLPWVRGNGVVGRSLERGVPVGCTVHYATRRVDAGPIVDRRLLPVVDGVPLRELEARADELAAEMMVDTVESIVATGAGPDAVAQEEVFPVSQRLSLKQRRVLDRAARAGRAAELFESWKGATVGGQKYRWLLSLVSVSV